MQEVAPLIPRERPADGDAPPAAALSLSIPESLLEAIAERAAELLASKIVPAAPVASRYLNVREAAEYLRCSRQRIYDLLSERSLSRLKDGSRVLLDREEIDTYISSSQRARLRRR